MNPDISNIPNEARKLTALGDQTLEALQGLYGSDQPNLFPVKPSFDIAPLADALMIGWSDAEAAKVINYFGEAIQAQRVIDLASLARWARSHVDHFEAVRDCMNVEPPEEIEVLRVLSRKGSQKLVFLAKWRLTLQDVVLKQIISTGPNAERVISRELQSSPLSIVHPNIIETHFMRNKNGERFLVERRLTDVLHDGWSSHGIYEAANLLFDIAKALKFLHAHRLVHGDVKPDNIGKKGTSYVLLDFGICRDFDEFSLETSATGSLRTRAPELLTQEQNMHPEKIDIWALGATVYRAIAKRFPLIDPDEIVPRLSNPQPRKQFETMLAERVIDEWERWVDLSLIPQPLSNIVSLMLERDPKMRISATDLLEKAEKSLSAFLRSDVQVGDLSGRFSPLDEVKQMRRYVSSLNDEVALIPRHKRQVIRARLLELETYQGFAPPEVVALTDLIKLFN
jgi:serine/threonine protein kinase